jgi:streptogramin lyase
MKRRNLYQTIIVLVVTGLMLVACSQEQGDSTASNQPAGNNAANTAATASKPTANTVTANTTLMARPAEPGGHSGVVEGMITDSSGKPVAGAFVKMTSDALSLGFMVISQDGGKYLIDRLPAGSFVVQSVGGNFQSEWSAPVYVEEGTSKSVNLSLNVKRAPNLPAAWPRRVPEEMASLEHLPDGPGKNIIAKNCSGCHSPNQVAGAAKTPEKWAESVEDMSGKMKDSGNPELSESDTKVLLAYLETNRPALQPPDPNSRFPRELMQGEARNYRIVQRDVPNKLAEDHDVAVDPWGVGWANQRTGGMISRFDPVSYEYSEIGPPLYTAKRARPGNLQITTDGIMWLADPFETRWLSYDIANEKWTDWPFPKDKIRGQVQGNSIALNPDGTIWMSGPGAARRLDPRTGEWSTWDTPTWLATKKNPGGYGITIDGKGRAWMSEDAVDKLARFDPVTGEVVEFDLESGAYPRRMDHDPAGNVWVGLWGASKIMRIDNTTGEMSIINPPIHPNGAYSIDFDTTNNLLWITLHTADVIARYNPDTKEWLMLPMMQAETDDRRVEVDQNRPNRVWWSTVSFNARIGYLELLK